MGINLPFYRSLTPDSLKQVDRGGRRLLAEVGVRLDDPAFLEKVEAAGARVDYDRRLAKFPGDVLDTILFQASPSFVLYSRDGRNDLRVGKRKSFFGNGGRVFRILDLSTEGYRQTLLRDVINTATLVEHLEYIRFYIIACQAHDVPAENYHYNDYFHALNHTTKHVMGGVDDVTGAKQLIDLATFIAGDAETLRRRPFVSVITNVMSPLIIDRNTLQILELCTSHGIPVTCATAPMAGATAPATLAGTLVQMHAEALAGVLVTQIMNPGAPVFYGAFPTIVDMRTMEITVGSVEMGMMNAAAVGLAHLYHLPIYASGGVTEAKRPDIQAGFEKSFSDLTVAMSRADIIHLTAGMVDSCNSISYEQFAIDNENIGMIHRILRGITVNEDTLALDVISDVGPGGNFLTADHTLAHMVDEYFYPEINVRLNFAAWMAKGEPDVVGNAGKLVRRILREKQEGVLDTDMVIRIKKEFPGIL